MSYARFAEDSDVYVFLSCNGDLECCSCSLKGNGACSSFATTEEMLLHLADHVLAGHDVPGGTFERLRVDAEENDAYIVHIRAGLPDDGFVWQ